MKTKIALIPAIALVALTACGTKTVYVTAEPASTPAPTTTAPITAPPTTEPAFTPGTTEDFIIAVESMTGPLLLPDSEVIETGILTCDFLRDGGSAYDVSTAVNDNPDPEFISAIVAAAIIILCPDQQYKFDDPGY
jgi:predicted small lipoprotein YifL